MPSDKTLLTQFNPIYLWQQNSFSFIIKSSLLLAGIILVFINLQQTSNEKIDSKSFLTTPKINDIYFLDFQKVSNKLRPHQKYRLAKVVDITGDVITLLYGDFYYSKQHQIKEAIMYGHLRFKDYFQTKRYDFHYDELQKMLKSGIIYLAKRPIYNKLYGNFVRPMSIPIKNDLFILGKREDAKGRTFLQAKGQENNVVDAFNYFTQSAKLGYPPGQVNLAEMYLNGQYQEKNLSEALYWFKQASLQSHKPAILKYVIVCQQLSGCSEYDFYQSLINAGVNLKVRELKVKIQ